MPNTAKGGGISRKITNIGDRKKLKETAKEFSIPDKMGLIIRTAGAKKTKSEIEFLRKLYVISKQSLFIVQK